jgi:hypothetical protein
MPNDIAPLPMPAADSTQPLPSSVARALRRAESDDHPDVPWRPPGALPPAEALRVALAMLTPRPADDRTIAACLAALVIAFEPNTKLSVEATRLRFEVWKEANGDLGNALWNEATQRAIRSLRWMPRPSELREQVRPILEARDLRRRRCERMLAERARRTAQPAAPQPQETLEERLANTVAIYRRHDRPADAERMQRRLDDLLKRKAAQIMETDR